MDEIISKLAGIESRASEVMDLANAKKKTISDEMTEKTEQWDRELTAETQKQIDALREKMKASISEQLSKQRTDAEKEISDMQASYDRDHNHYVDQLFHRMIGA